jgi:hypothetical protein
VEAVAAVVDVQGLGAVLEVEGDRFWAPVWLAAVGGPSSEQLGDLCGGDVLAVDLPGC